MRRVDSSLHMSSNDFYLTEPKREFLFLFVYLGSRVPQYLIDNVRQTADVFSGIDVVLATTCRRQIPLRNAIQLTLADSLLRAGGDAGFRGGFWSKTFDRLFAIEVVHERYPDHRVLHIEGDVKLSPNLNLQCFSETKLNWGQVTPSEDGAALVQSPTLEISRRLSELLRMEAEGNSTISDMSALANIRRAYPDIVELLPTAPENSTSEIFDFAPLGMWLGGTDPRNNRGVSYFRKRQGTHLVDPSKFVFEFRDELLLISKAQANESPNQRARVQNLHLHSKRVDLFVRNWSDVVMSLLKNSYSSRFSLAAFVAWAADRVGEYARAAKKQTLKMMGKR